MTATDKSEFLCPECGGKKPDGGMFVSSEPGSDDPWSSVLKIIFCEQCHKSIPAHLAERWDGITIEDAKKEWVEVYRATAPSSEF